MENFDVIIVGGGSAGLAASIALGRSRRKVLIIDQGKPRNAASAHAHNVLGHEGISPQKLVELGRAEAASYGVEFVSAPINSAQGSLADGFEISTTESQWSARRIILATGAHDLLPGIPGLQEAWGISALHCPYCHGWEVRDQKIAILGVSEMSTHQAMLFSQLSNQVTFINHEPQKLSAENRELLSALEVEVIDSAVDKLQVNSSGQVQSLTLTDGSKREVQAVVVASKVSANAALYLELGGQLNENPMGTYIDAEQTGATAVPGVYAAGNIANVGSMIGAAAAAGTMAGAYINAELALESVQEKIKTNK